MTPLVDKNNIQSSPFCFVYFWCISQLSASSSQSYQLGQHGGLLTVGDARDVIEFRFAQTDLFAIQRDRSLATTAANSYLTWTNRMVADVDGNSLLAVVNGQARNVSFFEKYEWEIDDLQNYCLGTRRGIAADRGRPAVGFVYISNGKLVHFIFISGRFLHKIMLQKARRGKEINRGVVDQPFSHLYFSAKMKKAKGCMGEGVRSYMPLFLSRTTSYVKTKQAGWNWVSFEQ